MSSNKHSYSSPLKKAIGHGSSKHGFSHWWWQRLTAVALIPLTLWFVLSVLCLVGADQTTANAWLAQPLNATIMLLFVLALLFHAQTGLQVVIEDYIHAKWVNLSLLLIIKFASVVMAMFAIISVLKVVLGS